MPLPPTAVFALLALMGTTVTWGFAAAPARRPRTLLTIVLFGTGLLAFPLSLGALAVRHPQAALLGITAGVCLLAVGAHFLRAEEGGGGGPGGGGPDDGPGGPGGPGGDEGDGSPPDWEAFDRARAEWRRTAGGVR